MFYIGCHLSASNGYLAMGQEAHSIGANVFQFFTRNPRGGKAKPMNLEDAAALTEFAKQHKFGRLLAHAPYTLNACSSDPKIRDFARMVMADDLDRLSHIPDSMYNFHPGSHVGQGVDVGIEQICDLLNEIVHDDTTVTVLLETMAGKGSEVGSRFEELRRIIDGTEHSDKMGVCLDTCHVNDGGYDIVDHLDDVLAEFDRIIGLDRLKAIHINDSMNPLGAHKDRHEKIGKGYIGLDAFARIINHPTLRDLPFYLETPNDIEGYKEEIALLKSLYQDK